MDSVEKRFWPKVQKGEGCWEWAAGRQSRGYGAFYINGVQHGAHRIAWKLSYGNIPTGLQVCHHCDNPPCVRIDHLFLGTAKDNCDDKEMKGRGKRSHGEANPKSKTTEAEVRRMREMYASGGWSFRRLASLFGLTKTVVEKIIHRQRWAHVA